MKSFLVTILFSAILLPGSLAAQSGKATSTITVTPVGETPQVASITTTEDTQSGAIEI